MFEKINRRSLRSFFGFCALAGFLAKAAAPSGFYIFKDMPEEMGVCQYRKVLIRIDRKSFAVW